MAETPEGFGEYVRRLYDRAMVNAGLADYEIAEVNKQFDHLIAAAITDTGEVLHMQDYR